MPDVHLFTRVHIRWMIRRDMEHVLRIESASFDGPWSEEDFLRALRQRSCIGMVAETLPSEGDQVVGYMVYDLRKHSIEMLNLTVSPEHRRACVGSQIVAKLMGKLMAHRRYRIGIELRESNLDAQLFFRAQGFEAVRVLRRSYDDTGEDGYRMVYRLRDRQAGDGGEPAARIAQ